MQATKWISAVAILLISTALFAADAGNVIVSHFEPLQRLSIRAAGNNTDNSGQKIQRAAPVELSFDALGKTFDLQLERNDRIRRAASPGASVDGIDIYRGQLADRPGSWARIVVFDGAPRGFIWDGAEMFALEAPGDSQLAVKSTIIYRLADALIVPGTMTCGAEELSGNGASAYSQLVGELDGVVAQAPGAVSEITMGAIGDYEFTVDRGGEVAALAAIYDRLNRVDGIFSREIGIQINVQPPEIFSDSVSNPFSTPVDPATNETDPRELLDELGGYRQSTPAQNSQGLTHLYTGRNLTGSTVGIAYSGDFVLCRSSSGAGLSQGSNNVTTDSLIAAHEIGHNFGAPHDGVPGLCESELQTFIMAPSVNGNDRFSACSITKMTANAAAASCVTALPVVDVAVALNNQSATVLLGANTVLDYDVMNNGVSPVSNVVADFTLPNNLALGVVTTSTGTCSSGAGTVSCSLGDVPGMTTRTVSIAATPISLGAGVLSATVTTADVDERPGNNTSADLLTVLPAVDLVVNTPTSAPVMVNAMTTVSAVVENRSVVAATAVTLSITLSNGLQANAASWSLGACTVTPQQVDCLGTNFAAQSNASLNINVTGISSGSKNLTVTLSSVEAEANPADNSINGSVRVNDPKDEEGGGSTAPIFLLLLTMTALLTRRRR
jgi:hypothetical protein